MWLTPTAGEKYFHYMGVGQWSLCSQALLGGGGGCLEGWVNGGVWEGQKEWWGGELNLGTSFLSVRLEGL